MKSDNIMLLDQVMLEHIDTPFAMVQLVLCLELAAISFGIWDQFT